MSGVCDPNSGVIWYVPCDGTGVCPLSESNIERVVPGDTLWRGKAVDLDIHYLITRDRRIIEYRYMNDEFRDHLITYREISPADFIAANCPPDGKLPHGLAWIKGAAAGTADSSTDPSTMPGTPPGTQREAKGTPDLPPDELTGTMKDLLTGAFELKALDLASCRPFPEIVMKGGLSSPDTGNVRDANTRLKADDLMKAKRGQNGGHWITAKGCRFIGKDKLSNMPKNPTD